ncbi:hypothetical protein E2C01_061026 [Portunus trituberculatus]|uniref:Uncharacterized protein n=1 Tax=Portunus trituberculatus TaxID=210409 RepID=A0A5B7H2R9_PORTR|nr:hypothetical protein [Portunus trituberculatus]
MESESVCNRLPLSLTTDLCQIKGTRYSVQCAASMRSSLYYVYSNSAFTEILIEILMLSPPTRQKLGGCVTRDSQHTTNYQA